MTDIAPTSPLRVPNSQLDYASDLITFIVTDPQTGEIRYANNVLGKRQALIDYQDGWLLCVAWTGKYKTDIFGFDYDVACIDLEFDPVADYDTPVPAPPVPEGAPDLRSIVPRDANPFL